MQAIFLKHLKLLVENLYGLILNSYGNPWQICPSPLLSCLLEGCVDNGMDMTNGGSRYFTIQNLKLHCFDKGDHNLSQNLFLSEVSHDIVKVLIANYITFVDFIS